MTDYDVESQREAAIESLSIKRRRLRAEIDQCFAAFKPYKHPSLFQAILYAIGWKSKPSPHAAPQVDIEKLRVLAVRIGQVELLIKRLKDGEDPRMILLEVVSNDQY